MGEKHKPAIAILASGGGSTAEAFIHATQDGRVDARVGLIVCNNPPEKAGIYDRVARLNQQYGLNIPVLRISGITHPEGPGAKGEQTLQESEAIAHEASKTGVALVCLMGYMKKIRGSLLTAYGWQPWMLPAESRMINTHPGPLPETEGLFGIHIQQRVLETGLGYSAHTVHVVSEEYDKGPIIKATCVPVVPGDTPQSLFDRVQAVEKTELPLVIKYCLQEGGVYGDS